MAPPLRRILPAELQGELGAPGLASYNGFLETWEENADLRWPNSVVMYDRMRRTDSHIGAVLRAARLPVLRTRWRFHGDDVDPRVLQACQAEFGLFDTNTAGRRPRPAGVVLGDVIRHALLALIYGHMPFEKVYQVGPPLPGTDPDGLPEYMAHLAKLDPRMPRSLTGIDVAPDGTLGGIRQWIPQARPGSSPSTPEFGYMHRIVEIPNTRLVYFCHEREGSDWTGTSILREAYRDWLLKDVLVRVNAQGIERQNMGIPVVSVPEDGDTSRGEQIATNVRSGATAGVSFGPGWDMKLVGITGDVRDALPSIEYHDQSAGRAALAMFLDLGHDGGLGHGALGDTFVEFFTMALNAELRWLSDMLTDGDPAHGIVGPVAEFVGLNFGPDEPYPTLSGDELTPESLPTAEGLSQLAAAGLLTHDPALEADLRRRFGLPPPQADPVRPSTQPPGGGRPQPPPGGPQPEPDADDQPDDDTPDLIVGGGTSKSAELVGSLDELEGRLARARARLASAQ